MGKFRISKWKQKITMFMKSHIRLLSVMILLVLFTFGVMLPLCLKDKPYSLYFTLFHGRTNYTKAVASSNRQRYREALEYFYSYARIYKNVSADRAYESAELVFTVISTRRYWGNESLGYLTQNVAALHKLRAHRSALFVCNVHRQTRNERNTEAEWLARYVHVVHAYQSSTRSVRNVFEREKQDYVFCLTTALKTWRRARYIIVLEDDVIPGKDSMRVLQYLAFPHADGWGYLKLYTLPKEQSYWSDKMVSLMDLLWSSVLSGFLAQGCFYLLIRPDHIELTRKLLKLIFCYGFLFGCLFCVLIGRQNLLQLKRTFCPYLYRLIPCSGASTTAIMYPAESAKKVVEHLDSMKCSNKLHLDFALDNYMKKSNHRNFAVEPNLVNHVGFYSSLRGALNKNMKEFVRYFLPDLPKV